MNAKSPMPTTTIFEGKIVPKPGETITFENLMSFAVSQPFMNDPPFAPQFYEALGRMFVAWGRFEFLFDRQLRYLISEAKKRGIDEEMQISFERKSSLFRKLFRKIPEIADKADEAGKIMDVAVKTSKDRNLILHSNSNGFTDAQPPFLNLVSIHYRNKQFQGHRLEVELTDLSEIIERAGALTARLIGVTIDFPRRFSKKTKTTQPPDGSGGGQTPPNPK